MHAISEARRVLTELDITKPDQIDLDRIAAAHRAEVVFRDIDGATARVMRLGEVARITISKRIVEVGARRFPIAHEIGHIRLGHEIPDGSAGDIVEPERAASFFAAEITMPELLIRPFCASAHATLTPARKIAREFTTSLLASAMRFVELTRQRCAIAYSRLGCVCWIKPSATFPEWIPKGTLLDPSSAAFDYHRGGTIETVPRMIAAGAWLPRARIDGSNVEIVEHSAAIPELGAVFTMLWIPDGDTTTLIWLLEPTVTRFPVRRVSWGVRYVYRPTYAAPDSLVAGWNALKSEAGDVQVFGAMMLVTDYGSNVKDMLALTKLVDVPKGSDGIAKSNFRRVSPEQCELLG